MSLLRRPLKALLVGLAVFLGLSAIPGGVALVAGFHTPPIEQLKGSGFADYTIPGLALALLVGGGAVLSAVLLARNRRFALPSAIASGLMVMSFEFIEVLAIGSPPGPARVMQMVYFGVGFALVAAAIAMLCLTERSHPSGAPNP